jgi:hypothetical protein
MTPFVESNVIHIAAGLERKTGRRPLLTVDELGRVMIPGEYLALMGLSGGGSVRLTACDRGFIIERADPGESPV